MSEPAAVSMAVLVTTQDLHRSAGVEYRPAAREDAACGAHGEDDSGARVSDGHMTDDRTDDTSEPRPELGPWDIPPPDPDEFDWETDWPPIPEWRQDGDWWIGSITNVDVAWIPTGKPKTPKALPRDQEGYLTIDEAAAYLHQGRSWVYQHIRHRGLPTYGSRGNLKIKRS